MAAIGYEESRRQIEALEREARAAEQRRRRAPMSARQRTEKAEEAAADAREAQQTAEAGEAVNAVERAEAVESAPQTSRLSWRAPTIRQPRLASAPATASIARSWPSSGPTEGSRWPVAEISGGAAGAARG